MGLLVEMGNDSLWAPESPNCCDDEGGSVMWAIWGGCLGWGDGGIERRGVNPMAASCIGYYSNFHCQAFFYSDLHISSQGDYWHVSNSFLYALLVRAEHFFHSWTYETSSQGELLTVKMLVYPLYCIWWPLFAPLFILHCNFYNFDSKALHTRWILIIHVQE